MPTNESQRWESRLRCLNRFGQIGDNELYDGLVEVRKGQKPRVLVRLDTKEPAFSVMGQSTVNAPRER